MLFRFPEPCRHKDNVHDSIQRTGVIPESLTLIFVLNKQDDIANNGQPFVIETDAFSPPHNKNECA